MAVIVKYGNGTVTDTYLGLIGNALTELGEEVTYVDSWRKVLTCPKDELIVDSLSREAFQLILRGYRHIILWFQGLDPEENWLVMHSRLKLAALNLMERIVVRNVNFTLYVSEAMKKYITVKYGIKENDDRCYCMPCMNTELHPESFFAPGKYREPSFAYVGSLTVWQSFEETAALYAAIEKAFDFRTRFLVFTGEREKAEQIIRAAGIRNYAIDFVPNEKLPEALAPVKYGFILRKDNPVNRVSTPTKISTYLSCGVIPVYSRCLEDFDTAARQMHYTVPDGGDLIKRLKETEAQPIGPDDVLAEYRRIFNTYYDPKLHLEKLKAKLKPLYESEWKRNGK